MLRLRTIALLCLPLLLIGARAEAAIIQLTANLTHDQETGGFGLVPPTTSGGAPRPLSFGSATFFLDTTLQSMTMSVTVFNIDVTGTQTADTNDNLVAAHIHAPAPPGTAAGVKWGFIGAPNSDTAPDQGVLIPFGTGAGGSFTSIWDTGEGNSTTLTAQIPDILAGLSYINFHTIQFPGGEIRGQIVPEPANLALLGIGLLGLFGARRRAH